METLSKLETRRQFDSVDPAITDDYPSQKETTESNFYELWAPVFAREARFSKTQPAPSLGGPETSKQEVESFYDFWYNLDSWRSFEYEDKDAPEGADSYVHFSLPNHSSVFPRTDRRNLVASVVVMRNVTKRRRTKPNEPNAKRTISPEFVLSSIPPSLRTLVSRPSKPPRKPLETRRRVKSLELRL